MNDLPTIVHRKLGSTEPGGYGLPPDLLAKARSRVAGLAAVLGALSLLALLLGATAFREQVGITVYLQHLLAVGLAVVVILAARSRSVDDTTALTFGLVYEVFLCWIVAFSATHAAVVSFGRPDEITWNSMIIVVFPMVVPLPPRRLLVASILGALGSPASLVILDQLGEYPLTIDELMGVSIGPAFAVILAYFGARMIYGMSLDVSRARLMGAYQLESRIGAGGMGEVWRASHRMLARPAAIKLIAPSQLGDQAHAMLTRFEQEAQATALLRSPHTVEVYDFGRSDDGSFYYVMELLDGVDLQDLVGRYGPLPASRVIHILRQACHSLGEAHSAGLVHRDIKPANIFLCRYGRDFDFVKVLDFGLVKQVKLAGKPVVTQKDHVLGTPAFMAPEMVNGAELDGRADIYALGCVAYWLLTGTLVFEAESIMALAAKHLHEYPVPPSECTELEVPADLDQAIMDCLRKEPAERPASAEELADRLSRIAAGAWTDEDAKGWWELRGIDGSTAVHG